MDKLNEIIKNNTEVTIPADLFNVSYNYKQNTPHRKTKKINLHFIKSNKIGVLSEGNNYWVYHDGEGFHLDNLDGEGFHLDHHRKFPCFCNYDSINAADDIPGHEDEDYYPVTILLQDIIFEDYCHYRYGVYIKYSDVADYYPLYSTFIQRLYNVLI